MKIKPVILCGGAGTRLWPKSKKNLPKEFIDWGGWTLFGKTLDRIKNDIFDNPIITTNSSYLKLVKKNLKKHKIKNYQIILEPYKKNTAPAILSSALIKGTLYNQPMIFFSSDNLIGKINQFNKSIEAHKNYLDEDNIFIFGIKPISPSSEYGYFITKKNLRNLDKVKKFIEKPNKNKVKVIIKKKGYMNSGIFFMRRDSIIRNFKRYQKNIYNHCTEAVKKSKNIYGIKLNIPLSDLGNWKEIWKFFKKNKSRNFIKKNTYHRPWGKYLNLFSGKGFLLKELVINPKSSISLQKHNHRSERWTIVSGKPRITINRKKFFKKPNESVFIPQGAIHRIENPYNKKVKIAEVQIGKILKETDIVRYKDIYGRVK